VEKANQSFQDRLTSELQRAQIQSLDEANHFLSTFVKDYNQRFAIHFESLPSVFDREITDEKINLTLAVIDERQMDKGNAIHFQNKIYQPFDKKNERVLLYPKTKVLVICTLNGNLYCSNDKAIYWLKELEEHEPYSKNFDDQPLIKKERKIDIPPLSHPWKRQSYLIFQEKQQRKQKLIKEKPFSVQS
jgi:hypothetical protein